MIKYDNIITDDLTIFNRQIALVAPDGVHYIIVAPPLIKVQKHFLLIPTIKYYCI